MKIKTLLIVGLLFSVANIFAQIPTGYYDGTAGLTGAALKTKLSQIITNGHQTKSYDNYTTDIHQQIQIITTKKTALFRHIFRKS
jgi:hypothetical protein